MSNQIIYPGVKGFPIPNRVFVGGLPSHVSKYHLNTFISVQNVGIIIDVFIL